MASAVGGVGAVFAHLLCQLLQPLASPPERAPRRHGRGREPTLQRREREAHGVLAVGAHDGLSAVEALSHVVAHVLVERLLGGRERVGGRARLAYREERLALEGQKLLLLQAPHNAAEVAGEPGAGPSLEAVGVEQLHELLEVGLLAVVRRGGHEQQVARRGAEQLSQPVAVCVVHLAAVHVSGHLMRLVHHHEVPAHVAEHRLQPLVAGELVHRGHH